MSKQADIINKFIQSKNKRKNRDNKTQTLNRLLGSQVLKTSSNIRTGKLKKTDYLNLGKLTTRYGFRKIMSDVRAKQSPVQRLYSRVIHCVPLEWLNSLINHIILKSDVMAMTFVLFFIANLFFYSICTILSYNYNLLITISLLVLSFLISLTVNLTLKLKSQHKDN